MKKKQTVIEYTENNGKTWNDAIFIQSVGGIDGVVVLKDIKTGNVKQTNALNTKMKINITKAK